MGEDIAMRELEHAYVTLSYDRYCYYLGCEACVNELVIQMDADRVYSDAALRRIKHLEQLILYGTYLELNDERKKLQERNI